MPVTIFISGLKELSDSLKRSPAAFNNLINQGLQESAELIRDRARRKAPSGVTNELRRSINYKLGNKKVTIGIDNPAQVYGAVVEYGRRPGKQPPSGPNSSLARWAQLKLGSSGAAFAVARKIAKKGTKAQPYLIPAAEETVDNDIDRIFGTLIAKALENI
jgi:hypothetical protein